MKATSFLNSDLVIVKASDGSYWCLPPKESDRWIQNFLYWVAGRGENTENVKDGKIEDGVFITETGKYFDLRKHKKVIP